MINLKRRTFLEQSALVGAMVGGTNFLGESATSPRFEIALSQYSLREFFKNKTLDPLDFPQYTVDNFGIKAIDLWEGGLPKDKLSDSAYLNNLKARAEKAGTHLFLLMGGALDANPKKSKNSIARLKASVDRASILNCTFLRVFLKAPGTDESAAIAPCVSALKELSDYAAKKNVMIAIEPGASTLSQKGKFLAKVAVQLKHPSCCLMPDFGKQKDNIYVGTEAMLPYSETISCKMHSFDEQGLQPHFDYDKLMKMIVTSDYKGYLAIEWEGSALKPVAGVKASKALIIKSLASAGVKIS